jgi:hypothetical protein
MTASFVYLYAAAISTLMVVVAILRNDLVWAGGFGVWTLACLLFFWLASRR